MTPEPRIRTTKFGLFATEEEIDQKLKESLTPEEYKFLKQGCSRHDEVGINRIIDLLTKAGITEEIKW